MTTAESYVGDKLSANTDDSNEEANENENIEVEREEERGDEFKNFLDTLHLDGAR